MDTPTPFEIIKTPEGLQVASNGQVSLSILDSEGSLFKRRAIKGLSTVAAGNKLLPLLNQFAGELLSNPSMAAVEVYSRLMALAASVHVAEPRHVEWVVAQIGQVKVYLDGQNVIVTTQELTP